MSRDIVDISGPADRLVVAAGIEGEPADQLSRSSVEHREGHYALGIEGLALLRAGARRDYERSMPG